MKKEEFIEEIKEILLIENKVDENTGIEVDSMASLLLIAFYDENFGKTITQEEIKKFKKISDCIHFAGIENFD